MAKSLLYYAQFLLDNKMAIDIEYSIGHYANFSIFLLCCKECVYLMKTGTLYDSLQFGPTVFNNQVLAPDKIDI